MEGLGKMIYIGQKSWYSGRWLNNQRNGYGTLYSNKVKYEGFWKNNKRHGKGKLTIFSN